MSSAECRWFVFGLVEPKPGVIAVPEGSEYAFTERTCSRVRVRELCGRLCRAGRLGIAVFSPSWEAAVEDAEAIFRIKVRERQS